MSHQHPRLPESLLRAHPYQRQPVVLVDHDPASINTSRTDTCTVAELPVIHSSTVYLKWHTTAIAGRLREMVERESGFTHRQRVSIG